MIQTTSHPQQESSSAESEAMIEAHGLTKYYGQFIAAEDVRFSIPKGQIAAFLGPNGAGKSTTMKMLTGYLAPSAGTAKIGGYDVTADRLEAAELLGYLPENGPLYNEMTPLEFLRYCGSARGMRSALLRQRLEYVCDVCALETVWEKPIGKLSKGFRQRVGMAQAILHDPQILILDEPTSGLDPNQIHDVRELITTLGQTKTILLSTHLMAEVQALCNHIVMISKGRVVMNCAASDFSDSLPEMESKFREMTKG